MIIVVKGTNRAVIEVYDTGSPYIEKAILFINPAFKNANPKYMKTVAREYLSGVGLEGYSERPKRQKINEENLRRIIKLISTVTLALFCSIVLILILDAII